MSGGTRTASARPFTVTNVGFFGDRQGILRLVQAFVGILCMSLVAYYCGRDRYGEGVYSGFKGSSAETYFFLITFSCLKVTLVLFASYVVSLSTATVLPKTFVEVIYHSLAAVLYLTASISLLVVVVQRNSKLKLYLERGYGGLISAGLFGGICLGLVFTYGTSIWFTFGTPIGSSYAIFITSSAAAVIGAAVALFSYLISVHTFRTVRNTVYEIVQNLVACILYLGASSFLLIQTSLFLWPMYLITPYFQAYPALMTAGVFGIASSVIHFYDAYVAYRTFKS